MFCYPVLLLLCIKCTHVHFTVVVSYAGEVFMLIMRYLVHICIDDIVAVNDHLNIISSSFSVLAAVFGSWDAIEYYLVSGKHSFFDIFIFRTVKLLFILACWLCKPCPFTVYLRFTSVEYLFN